MKLETKPGCEFCDKRGLPVLLARYAIAPVTAGAPKTRALDADGKTDFGGLGDTAHYTRRLLRTGYLYVHDEARKRWEGYFITNGAHYMRFEVGKPVPPSYTADRIPCADRTGHWQVAGMVTIPDPNNATLVWFGFSDVEWTDAVLQKHADAAYRKKHMQMLDVKKALTGAKQANVHPLKQLGVKVAEYACDPLKATAPDAFYDAPFHFAPRKRQLQETLDTADALRKGQGVLLSLHDPVAVAVEIAAQANSLLTNYLELNKRDQTKARKIAVSSAIMQLRGTVLESAEHSLIDSAEFKQVVTNAVANGGMFGPSDSQQKEINAIGTPSLAEVQKAQAAAWRRYTHRQSGQARFDEATVQTFHESYQAQLKTFTETQIDPLGKAHVAWTTSAHMVNCMTCNFDSNCMKSGVAYTQTVCTFTRGTEGIAPCFAQHERWLDSDHCKPDNMLLRALVYNNDTLAKQVVEATAFDSRAIPWDGLMAAYKAAVEKISKGHADLAAALMGRMMGAFAKVGGAFVDGAAKLAFTILGMHSGLGWQRMHFAGSRKEFRAFLVRQLIESSDVKLNQAQIKLAVDRELKRAAIRGEKLDGRGGFKWVAMREKGSAKLSTPKSLNEIRFKDFKSVLNTEVRMGVCVGILQYVCLTKSIADQAKALEGDKAEAMWRLRAGKLAVAGSISEAVGVAIEHAGKVDLPWARSMSAIRLNYVLQTGGKVLGIIGAAIMAVWDVMKGWEELQKNNYKTMGLYFSSAALGFTVAVALTFCTFNPFILLLVAAFLGVAYFLEKAKDNAIQSWIENCIFGIGNVYKDGTLEMKELNQALS